MTLKNVVMKNVVMTPLFWVLTPFFEGHGDSEYYCLNSGKRNRVSSISFFGTSKSGDRVNGHHW